MWLAAWVACSPSSTTTVLPPGDPGADPQLGPSEQQTATVSRCPAGDTTCVDAETVPVAWQFETGYRSSEIAAGDLNGDGEDDAIVWLEQDEVWGSHVSILWGPVGDVRLLPLEEDLGLDGESIWAGDLTGDGVYDLLIDRKVYLGPFGGGFDAAAAAGELPDADGNGQMDGWPVDIDLDRDWEFMRIAGSSDTHLEISTGSWTAWGDPPDLTLSMPCSGTQMEGPRWSVVPDLDHDGVAELLVAGGWPDDKYNDCAFYLVPADVTGMVDVPSRYPLAPYGPYGLPKVFGDQDGDGFTDFLIDNAVVSGPLALTGDVWSGAREIGVLSSVELAISTGTTDLTSLMPAGASVVGSADEDLVMKAPTAEYMEYTTWFVEGGPAGGWSTGTVAWSIVANERSACGPVIGDQCAYRPLHQEPPTVRLLPIPR